MEDVVPGLFGIIDSDFSKKLRSDTVIKDLYKKVREGNATYKEANEFAIKVGELLAESFKNNLSSDVLPDGKMYYNIAKRIIEPMLKNNHELITSITDEVQARLNKIAGINIKPQTPKFNKEKANGIIDRISSEEDFGEIAWILDEPVITFSQSIVDDAIKANAEFHGKSGLTPKIIRRVAGDCCEWCREVSGTYIYPEVPEDVYRRHQRCRCTVVYNPGDGKVQNVYSKKWMSEAKYDKITIKKDNNSNKNEMIKRKVVGLKIQGTTIKEMSKHVYERMEMRDVDIDDILDTINNPLDVKPIRYDAYNRPSFEVIGRKATFAINPDNGTIITVHKTHSKLVKKLLNKKGGNT